MRRALLLLTAVSLSSLPTNAVAAPAGDPATAAPRYRTEHRAGPLANASWWKSFRDGKLDALVERGLTDSYDIATAQSRVDEADAVIEQNLGPLLPSLTWDTSVNMAPLDSLGFQFGGATGGGGGMPMSDPPELYYTASSVLNLGVEIDLTGRNTLAYRASERDADASRRDLQAQRVDLGAAIVAAYYDVITAQLQLELVREQVATNEELLAITKLRFENGQANAVDVLQQQQQVEAAKILVPQAETQLRTFEQQLAVLVGQTPNNRFPVADRLPALPPQPAVGRPADLLESRPDLRAAQARVDSAQMREKSARRQFAPSLRLSAQGGAQGIYIEEWNTPVVLGGRGHALGPALRRPPDHFPSQATQGPDPYRHQPAAGLHPRRHARGRGRPRPGTAAAQGRRGLRGHRRRGAGRLEGVAQTATPRVSATTSPSWPRSTRLSRPTSTSSPPGVTSSQPESNFTRRSETRTPAQEGRRS